MKIISLVVILLFNCVGGLLSYQWCYQFIRKHSTPESHFLILYCLCYFCFILISVFMLDKIKRPSGLIFCGIVIGVLINFISWIVRPFIMGDHNTLVLDIDAIIAYLCISSGVTLNFIIYPAILLCCHYSIFWIEKIYKKCIFKQW